MWWGGGWEGRGGAQYIYYFCFAPNIIAHIRPGRTCKKFRFRLPFPMNVVPPPVYVRRCFVYVSDHIETRAIHIHPASTFFRRLPIQHDLSSPVCIHPFLITQTPLGSVSSCWHPNPPPPNARATSPNTKASLLSRKECSKERHPKFLSLTGSVVPWKGTPDS